MELETPRLTLRPLHRRDVGALYAIQGDREAMRFTWVAPSLGACAERLDAYEALRSTHGFAPWVAILREEDRVIGWGGLCVDPFAPGWGVEVVYFLHPTHWRRGFATEIVRASVDDGFGRLALDRIAAFARPENVASIRVLEKCGFSPVGWEPALERNHYEVRRAR
jgi:RimJ/RimL family protein N-acetyltransferase